MVPLKAPPPLPSFFATVTHKTLNGALLAPLMAPPLPVTSPTRILCDSHVQIVQRRAPQPPLRALTAPGFNGAPPRVHTWTPDFWHSLVRNPQRRAPGKLNGAALNPSTAPASIVQRRRPQSYFRFLLGPPSSQPFFATLLRNPLSHDHHRQAQQTATDLKQLPGHHPSKTEQTTNRSRQQAQPHA